MTLTIIDTFGFLFRNFYAIPLLHSKDGTPTNMITGFMNFISSLEEKYPTDYIVFTLDSKEDTFRKEIYKEYKSNRKEPPKELQQQLPIAIDLIKKMGFKILQKPGYESDDLIASLTKIAKNKGLKVRIVSHDKDMYQLIDDDKVVIFDPVKEIEINEEKCKEKFGIYPKDFINFQALLGDSSDNIPGVKGVGVKTAAKLINEYHTLENIYKNIDKIKGALQKKLLQDKENAFLSRELVKLRDDLLEDINLEEFKFPKNPILKVEDDLKKLNINAVLKRVKAKNSQNIEFEYETIKDSKKLFQIIDQIDDIVSFDTETDNLENPNIVGFSFAFNNKAYYVPLNHKNQNNINLEDGLKAIKEILNKKIIGHNLKFDFKMLNKYNIKTPIPFCDTMILAWIINPDDKLNLDYLAEKYLGHKNIKYKDIVSKKENFSDIEIEIASKYASEDAFITLKLYNTLKKQLYKEVEYDIKQIEMPFINLLIDIENQGIKIDIEYLKSLEIQLKEEIENIKKEIFHITNEEFNINSPKQLATILFEKLKLPPKRKTKTGYSTDERVLLSLKDKHPIISMILNYRRLDKLLNTYIIPLQKHALLNKEHKIYTTFLQTGTATGRLSSKNPNLQNIPVEKDVNIRNAFITDKLFASLDYSQIELRLLAHFSKDPHLIKAFLNNEDIHLQTAKKLFGKDAYEKRNIAKSINFGLIYGMGAKKLSETINVSLKEAKEFIEKYFENFPTVKEFLEETKQKAHNQGYIQTLLKRRRYFNFQTSAKYIAAYEREAVNTLFQGSAADIIKKAMIEIKEKFPHSKMVLQIHDELIFEITNKDEVYEYKNIMENSFKLEVPLKVDISFAKKWGELK